ncbi:pirin family protein [Senegalia massiliensis]|uniref:Pirin family protein n=1 Tax=Senegalia massiliensis TaxID=1720316 RepID=A0A845QTY6_9CLOT|nr:pirin family protein [Senegalia massiliensis]NBI06307.1 pirin family protein [Senegalia massiliensis]
MLRKVEHDNMGTSDLGWLKSIFHFSFSNYYNPDNMNFGVLRVLNDDLVESNTGFDMHPHREMEIISYVVNGELTHGDNMGNENKVTRGHVQYMTAGTGIYHSEHNLGDDVLRFLQIWIVPDKKGHNPNYGDYKFDWEKRKNKWFHIVSSKNGKAPIKINQDVNFYVLELDKDNNIDFSVDKNRQAYLVQIEGSSNVNNISLVERDAMEIVEEDILIKANDTSHMFVIEMKKV